MSVKRGYLITATLAAILAVGLSGISHGTAGAVSLHDDGQATELSKGSERLVFNMEIAVPNEMTPEMSKEMLKARQVRQVMPFVVLAAIAVVVIVVLSVVSLRRRKKNNQKNDTKL